MEENVHQNIFTRCFTNKMARSHPMLFMSFSVFVYVFYLFISIFNF